MATLTAGEKARMYALGKIMRGGASRGGYVSGAAFISIDGVQVGWGATPHRVLLDTLTITDELDETPNTCGFRLNGLVPAAGAEVVITLGSKNAGTRLYAGFALTVQQLYVGDKPANVQADVRCVDYTWQFGFVLVTRQYRTLSASAIAADLVTRYAAANGFTSTPVVPNLPVLDEITFTNEPLDQALTRIARRIGGYWFVDYQKGVHLFLEDTPNAPEPLTPTHKSLRAFQTSADRTQVLTRVYVEGRGSASLATVAAGDTIIPLAAVDMFTAAPDVFVKVSPVGSEGGAQHLTFTGVTPGGTGSIVGPGVTPASAPSVTAKTGAGLNAGTHQYAYTWGTATGETPPSPVAAVVAGAIVTPVAAPVFVDYRYDVVLAPDPATGFVAGATVRYAVTYSTTYTVPLTSNGQPVSALGPPSAPITAIQITTPDSQVGIAPMYVNGPVLPDPVATYMHFWVSVSGGPWYYANNYTGNPNAGLVMVTGPNTGGTLPAANAIGQATVAGIAVGPTGTTTRKVYRTAANATALQLLRTIADNVTTSVVDAAADATLGVAAPGSDTSGLVATPGQVTAGSTSIRVAGTGPFPPEGSWVLSGNNRIRYTSLTGIALTGIPATGPGSILNSIPYGTPITLAPCLTGIPASGARAITTPIAAGDEIYLVVQRDDSARQATVADMVNGGPGVREEWVQDRRLSITEARARAQATLQLRPLEDVTVTYVCRDVNTASGKTITVNLPAPTHVSGTFKIQSVTINNFRPHPTQSPTYTVTASSRRFNFEDWLRRLETSV